MLIVKLTHGWAASSTKSTTASVEALSCWLALAQNIRHKNQIGK